jgi:antitoxin VapB
MALNLKNPEVERLAAEVAALAGESKTEAVRRALEERRDRLALERARIDREASLMRVLERDIWPRIPASLRGKGVPKAEREAILGYGPEGV